MSCRRQPTLPEKFVSLEVPEHCMRKVCVLAVNIFQFVNFGDFSDEYPAVYSLICRRNFSDRAGVRNIGGCINLVLPRFAVGVSCLSGVELYVPLDYQCKVAGVKPAK